MRLEVGVGGNNTRRRKPDQAPNHKFRFTQQYLEEGILGRTIALQAAITENIINANEGRLEKA